MPTAHVLMDVRRDALPAEQLSRAVRAKTAMEQLGYDAVVYGESLIDRTHAQNLEVQMNVPNGHQSAFADKFEEAVKEQLQPDDVIIATEPWHERCFKGLLAVDGGRYRGVPVVELWIEHLQSFARYRVFSTRFAMYATAGLLRQSELHVDWLCATPYYPAELTKDVSVHTITPDRTGEPASMTHLDASARGTPVVAPDWGAPAETVAHGLTGYLYRTPAGYAKVLELAAELPSAPIVDWVNETFSLDRAVQQLERYFNRVLKRG